MIERLLIVMALSALGSGAYLIARQAHIWRLGRAVYHVGQPTLLYFRSDNCLPCVTQAYYLDQLQGVWHGRLAIQKIDADAEPDKASRYHVFTLPTTILVDALGKVRQINYGLTNSQKLSMQVAGLQVTGD